ncbi:MAG TPA: hypothetical protein VF799_02810 [Geobacteraceae bacterium]
MTETMGVYQICGLTVASEIDLPCAKPVDTQGADPDVTLRRGRVPSQLEKPISSGPIWEVEEGRMLLRIPKVARFLMTKGREVLFEPEKGSGDENLAIFLLGSALGGLLHQRGCFLIHGSAVAVNGAAAVFCGKSGSGKSTLAAALSLAGYPVITDDMCLVRFNGKGRPTLMPDGRSIKLWSDTIKGLEMDPQRHEAIRPCISKYWVDPPASHLSQPLPIGALYFIREKRAPFLTAGISPMKTLDAMELLRDNAYRQRLVKVMNQEKAWFEDSIAIFRRGVRAYWLTIPRQFDALRECVEGLSDHWRDIALTLHASTHDHV